MRPCPHHVPSLRLPSLRLLSAVASVAVFTSACSAASTSSSAGVAPPASTSAVAAPAVATIRAAAAPSASRVRPEALVSKGTAVPGAAGCPMFPADNIWNTDISKLPVDPHSAAWLGSMRASTTFLHPDFGPDPGGYPYGIPYAIVTGAHKTVRVKFVYASESNRVRYPLGPDTPIEGGMNAPADTDRHALMVNRSTCTLYELWQAHYSASGSTAGSGAVWNLRSNALRPDGWTSADAAGLPILPGLLNFAQIQQAVRTGKPITHAIRFTAQVTAAAYIWPARHEAGSGSITSRPPMGARFRLRAAFNVAGFCRRSQPYCADAKAVLLEMQHYGLILADNGSNWYFGGSAFPQWPDDLVSLLKQIPASSFVAVDTSCLMVNRDSGQARARAGCPIG